MYFKLSCQLKSVEQFKNVCDRKEIGGNQGGGVCVGGRMREGD